MSINWQTIGQERFDDIVELLLLRRYSENTTHYAAVLNGRGGDGGLDVAIYRREDHVLEEIYQLKYFPEGFSGGHAKSRRPQIHKSMKTAANHAPTKWWIVLPVNATVPERKHLTLKGQELLKLVPGVIGETELNSWLVDDPDAARFAERDEVRAALIEVHRQTASLSTMSDAAAEAQRLASRADTISPYWGFRFSSANGMVTQELVAKRDDAEEMEPLGLKIETAFDESTADLADAYAEGLAFGFSEVLTLPHTVVRSVEREGPAWFAGVDHGGSLEIHPGSDHRFTQVTLTVVQGGAPATMLTSRDVRWTSGSLGGTLTVAFPGGYTQRWKFARESGTTRLGIDIFPAGQSGTSVARAFEFTKQMAAAEDLLVEIDRSSFSVGVPGIADLPEVSEGLDEALKDISFIDRELGTTLLLPEDGLSVRDRIALRCVAMLLRGQIPLLPSINGLRAELSGTVDKGLEQVLTSPNAIHTTAPSWRTVLLGTPVLVPEVSFYHPHVLADDGSGVLERLRRGEGIGEKVHLKFQDGIALRAWMPSRRVGRDEEQLSPSPWGLFGVTEHPSFAQADPGLAVEEATGSS